MCCGNTNVKLSIKIGIKIINVAASNKSPAGATLPFETCPALSTHQMQQATSFLHQTQCKLLISLSVYKLALELSVITSLGWLPTLSSSLLWCGACRAFSALFSEVVLLKYLSSAPLSFSASTFFALALALFWLPQEKSSVAER